MRSCVFLLTLLGLFLFLSAHHPLWLACSIIYFGGMLVVSVVAFATRRRPKGLPRNVVLDNEQCQKEQNVSEELKAAQTSSLIYILQSGILWPLGNGWPFEIVKFFDMTDCWQRLITLIIFYLLEIKVIAPRTFPSCAEGFLYVSIDKEFEEITGN